MSKAAGDIDGEQVVAVHPATPQAIDTFFELFNQFDLQDKAKRRDCVQALFDGQSRAVRKFIRRTMMVERFRNYVKENPTALIPVIPLTFVPLPMTATTYGILVPQILLKLSGKQKSIALREAKKAYNDQNALREVLRRYPEGFSFVEHYDGSVRLRFEQEKARRQLIWKNITNNIHLGEGVKRAQFLLLKGLTSPYRALKGQTFRAYLLQHKRAMKAFKAKVKARSSEAYDVVKRNLPKAPGALKRASSRAREALGHYSRPVVDAAKYHLWGRSRQKKQKQDRITERIVALSVQDRMKHEQMRHDKAADKSSVPALKRSPGRSQPDFAPAASDRPVYGRTSLPSVPGRFAEATFEKS